MAGEVEVMGEEELIAKLIRAGSLTVEDILEALMVGGEILRDEMKQQIDRQGLVDKGELKGSMAAQIVRKVVYIGTDQGFRARIHETGGIISRKRARALKLVAGGGWKTKQQVSIPARPFMRPAVDAAANQMQVEINQKLRVVLRRRIGI